MVIKMKRGGGEKKEEKHSGGWLARLCTDFHTHTIFNKL